MPPSIPPKDAGLPRNPVAAIHGGDPAYNALALRRLLTGERGAYRDAVLLNAAAALVVAARADTLTDAAAIAAETLDSGGANTLLDAWTAYSSPRCSIKSSKQTAPRSPPRPEDPPVEEQCVSTRTSRGWPINQ